MKKCIGKKIFAGFLIISLFESCQDYEETPPGEETIYFPEPVYRWTYQKGFKVFIGGNSGKVLEIISTYPQAETNLGVKIGDTAAKVFEIYRPKYIEPESIHGGKLTGRDL